MPRGAVAASQKAIGQQQNTAKNYGGNAKNLYSTLQPELQAQADNPQGYGANDLAAMNTANEQSIGGSTAGAVGQGNLTAARTRNRGGFTGALDEAVRSGGRQLSQNAVDIQGQNAALKQQQRQSALQSLQQLYGSNVQAQLAAMGLTPGTIGQWTNAASATTNGVLGGINTAINFLKPSPTPA